jgi:hypothetical protein
VSRQRKPSRQVSVDEQIQVVLAVLNGELSLAEAARRHGVAFGEAWATGGTGSSTRARPGWTRRLHRAVLTLKGTERVGDSRNHLKGHRVGRPNRYPSDSNCIVARPCTTQSCLTR